MISPTVKVCGICRAEDAELAIALGAAAIGFVFWPHSPRYCEPDRARAIAARAAAVRHGGRASSWISRSSR